MTVKIILVDDHIIMREGLRALLHNSSDIRIVGEADNGREAINLAQKHAPDIVIMDITMPDMNGIDATYRMLTEQHPPRIIALSMHSDKRFVEKMIRAGASGYLLKNCATKELLFAIRAVAKGQIYLSPGIAGTLVKDYLDTISSVAVPENKELTVREREIVQLIAEGRDTKQIAENLCLSPKTIETHRRKVFEKLNFGSIAELTKYAIREGLTGLEAE